MSVSDMHNQLDSQKSDITQVLFKSKYSPKLSMLELSVFAVLFNPYQR